MPLPTLRRSSREIVEGARPILSDLPDGQACVAQVGDLDAFLL
jgi:hypothetical protein